MKAKAASKSTNWKLRVMASRPAAICQSGNRFSALLRSSIANFAIVISLQFVALLDAINTAIPGELAGTKMKRVGLEFGAGIKPIVAQPVQHPGHFGMAQPRQ